MDLNTYLLGLYRATHELAPDQFVKFAFNHTGALLSFDSARLMAVEVIGSTGQVHAAMTHNEPDSLHLDWEAISKQDTVLRAVTAAPGKAFNFNARYLYAEPEQLVVRDYATRYSHENGLVIAALNPVTGYWDGLSLYRARSADQFSKDEQTLLELIAPHLRQAVTQAMQHHGEMAEPSDAIAIIGANGVLKYCSPAFVDLVRVEFPDWRDHSVPAPIVAALSQTGVQSFCGAKVKVNVQRYGSLLFVRAANSCPLARLSTQELKVARMFSAGYSYKEVAQKLNLAPATVRNVIQRVYAKLDICGKAELATLVSHATI
ncbi:helix-turn-helix transcriptional regulator [Massilia sp. CCM 8734]|uniref:helix-turn-helix domain-containing protein n=1 Tax=Massilia sp. CCM 8734 TaxID=2609283 RepID=UPI00141F9666|nr:helix-turn-helix transcriptional regulator [Massilia sp. CCM 8734]NHZ96727.1 hypothetical protein [Massilia sp. CCM 8734]